jgi:hypothetical protein
MLTGQSHLVDTNIDRDSARTPRCAYFRYRKQKKSTSSQRDHRLTDAGIMQEDKAEEYDRMKENT